MSKNWRVLFEVSPIKKIFLLAAFIAVLLASSGCFLFEPFDAKDAIANASRSNWTMQVELSSDKRVIEQIRGTFVKFTRNGRKEEMPEITRITVFQTWNTNLQYSFSANAISKLRSASGGRLLLIIYDDGFECMPPEVKIAFPATQSSSEYVKALNAVRADCAKWTAEQLGAADQLLYKSGLPPFLTDFSTPP